MQQLGPLQTTMARHHKLAALQQSGSNSNHISCSHKYFGTTPEVDASANSEFIKNKLFVSAYNMYEIKDY